MYKHKKKIFRNRFKKYENFNLLTLLLLALKENDFFNLV